VLTVCADVLTAVVDSKDDVRFVAIELGAAHAPWTVLLSSSLLLSSLELSDTTI